MDTALTIGKYLDLNRGKYLRETVRRPRAAQSIYVTTHHETAATDLLHYHETAHLSLVLRGGVIDGRRAGETVRRAGGLMFFRAGEPHRTIYRGFPVKNINIELDDEFFRRHAVSETVFARALSENPQAALNVLKIYGELRAGDEFSEAAIEMLLVGLTHGPADGGRSRPPWLEKVRELLNDNWDENLSLDALARAARVHPKTISKYFPRYFACTLGEYRRRLKIERSLALIKDSKYSLTEIAHRCGFYDQSHFTGTFKQLTGFAPKQFRKL